MRIRKCFPRLLVAICLVALAWQPRHAGAGGVRDVVKDLYGGDGILLAPPAMGFDHAPHFAAASLKGLDNLSTAVTSGVGVFAFNSTVTGFTFDIERGVPVRTTDSLGAAFAERAPTLGAKKLNIAVSYTRIEFQRFEGTDLDDLELTFTHDDVTGDGRLGPPPSFAEFELDQIQVDLDLEVEQDILAFFATYGVTRNWDVGFVVPIIRSHARAEGNATIIDNSPSIDVHFFDPASGSDEPRSVVDRDATGIGDVFLRTKYNFLRKQPPWPDLAVVGQVKLPTGDEDDLLGTGETTVLGLLVASKSFDKLTPHLNLGYEWSTESKQSNLRYIAGFDAGLHPDLTVGLDVLGRWEPDGDDIGDHTIDLALGAKWNPFGSFLVNAAVLTPLNRDSGLRADVIWTLGVEWTF